MAKSVYVASVEGHTAKSVIALGVLEALNKKYQRVGVFRAISKDPGGQDEILQLLLSNTNTEFKTADCIGVSYSQMRESADRSISTIIERFKAIENQCDAVVVLGSDYTDIFSPAEFSFNARVATNLGTPMILVFNGREIHTTSEHLGQAKPRSSQEILSMAEAVMVEVAEAHTTILAAVVNRADESRLDSIKEAVGNALPTQVPVWVVPEDPRLPAPRMQQILRAVDGKLAFGSKDRLNHEAMDLVVAAMTPEHVLQRISQDAVVVVPADRTDVLLALLMADTAKTFPKLAGIVLNGGFEIPTPIRDLIAGLDPEIPVITTDGRSFDTTIKISSTRGVITSSDPEKIQRARDLVLSHIEVNLLIERLEKLEPKAITPLLFEYSLGMRSKLSGKTIVLPEGEDDRILQAADLVLQRNLANLIILGDTQQVLARSKELGLDLSSAQIMNPATSNYYQDCVDEYVKLRSHKGMTIEQARQTMLDVSYFGTMLVQLGVADGMVSGAAHTTAHTIKPAFEFIKARPGVDSVSSVFLMALEDRVLVYGDCAVIPEPTVEQLADIAISSAQTAVAFDIEPHVAMLSYSTGESGSGVDVDRVRQATALVRERAPELSVEGPIQYDAAVDAAVAKAKLPGSSVAGRATVFVFPDLNTGNNTYKAVQRTSGALAIGPILQGLNKPVNDLSRGALVQDIVNTIAITAIQAAALDSK